MRTLREDGLQKVGKKAKLYLKRRREAKTENRYADGCFRDVLFINGCDENLPHPGRYRVTHQREQLESLGMTTGEVYYKNLQLDTLRCYRIFIFFRCPYTDAIGEFVQRAKELNKSVLYDVDDLVIDTVYTDMIPYLDTMSEEEKAAYDDNVRSMGKLLRMCDGAITTTSGLAQELEEYVPKILINRNVASEEMVKLSLQALEDWTKQEAEKKRTENRGTEENAEHGATKKEVCQEPVKLGYFSGSITHNDDFELILPVLLSLLEQYPHLELHITGELSLPEKLLPYENRIVTHPFVDWKGLPELIRQVDINLAPLTNTTFNRAKSENKWVEAALVKVPTVASDIGAFHEMVENGKTGILCQNESQWEAALCALIEQPQYRELIGQAAFNYCSHACVTANTGLGLLRFLQEQKRENIAFILPGFQISGGVMVALQHCRMLREAGKDVLLLSIDEKGKEAWYEFEDCCFPVLNCNDLHLVGTIDRGVATMWSTVKWLEQYSTIVKKAYLVQNYEPDFYNPGDPLRVQARRTYGCLNNIQYLTISRWCQEWLEQQYGHFCKYAPNGLELKKFRKESEAGNEAQKIDFSTDRAKQEVSQKAGAADSNVNETAGDKRKVRILIEGDCSAFHKNVDESFRITEKLDPEQYEIWYMAYHGEPKDWYRIDKFLPQVPYEKVQEIYQQCDILLKSSVLESFSYPPLEMMASGGCVVAVLNEGNREYLVDGENCLTYPLGEVEQGVEAIQRIAEDHELRQKLQEGGRLTAETRDWGQIKEEILKLYMF